MLTDERRAEIRARCDVATAGPWAIRHDDVIASTAELPIAHFDCERPQTYVARVCWNGHLGRNARPTDEDKANEAFISNARQDIPDLLAEVDRLRAMEDKLAKTADGVAAYPGMIVWRPDWMFPHRPLTVEPIRWAMANQHGEPVDKCYSTPEAAEAAKEKT